MNTISENYYKEFFKEGFFYSKIMNLEPIDNKNFIEVEPTLVKIPLNFN